MINPSSWGLVYQKFPWQVSGTCISNFTEYCRIMITFTCPTYQLLAHNSTINTQTFCPFWPTEAEKSTVNCKLSSPVPTEVWPLTQFSTHTGQTTTSFRNAPTLNIEILAPGRNPCFERVCGHNCPRYNQKKLYNGMLLLKVLWVPSEWKQLARSPYRVKS